MHTTLSQHVRASIAAAGVEILEESTHVGYRRGLLMYAENDAPATLVKQSVEQAAKCVASTASKICGLSITVCADDENIWTAHITYYPVVGAEALKREEEGHLLSFL